MLHLQGGWPRWYGDTSPPQALPTAFEAEKRSDGRSLTGSCLGDTTLHQQGHSLLVCSRSQHKGCGFSQSGWIPLQSNWKSGNIRNEAGAPCSTSLSSLMGNLGTTPSLGGRELATDLRTSAEEGNYIPSGLI